MGFHRAFLGEKNIWGGSKLCESHNPLIILAFNYKVNYTMVLF